MNKNTLTAILMGLVICLGIVVIVLSIKLSIRPKADSKSDIGTSGTNVVTGEPSPSATPTPDLTPTSTPEPEVETVTVQMVRVTATVNVRSRPDSSTQETKLGTAAVGSEFVMLEELDNGWTRIEYGDSTAYIASKYLEKFEKQVEVTPTPTPQ